MNLNEQILAQATLLAGELSQKQRDSLGVLCTAISASLQSRLRNGLTPEDCKADFVAAASLMALASLSSIGTEEQLERITAGDFTIQKRSGDAACNCLRAQAELMISPYLKDRFSFQGV